MVGENRKLGEMSCWRHGDDGHGLKGDRPLKVCSQLQQVAGK